MSRLSCCAIIPARGGSKGIPRKNLARLAGRPLIAHTIVAAHGAARVDRVVVSTDDHEIARTAASWGADVVERPAALSGDTNTSESALLHALDVLAKTERYGPDVVAFLQCTSPLTVPADVDGTIALVTEGSFDTALTVTPSHSFLWRRRDGDADGVNHDKRTRMRRQEREPEFLETGAVYAMRVEGFLASRHRFFGRTGLYEVPRTRSVEIDEQEDLNIAVNLLRCAASLEEALRARAQPRGLVLDFDGVFTDDRVVCLEDGREAIICNRGDGLGLERLKKSGLPILVLSKEKNRVVSARCQKLGIPCLQGVEDKKSALLEWASRQGFVAEEVVYVGNDVNDIPCLELAGLGIAVADAHPTARHAAGVVLSSGGGRGALREVCDALCRVLGVA